MNNEIMSIIIAVTFASLFIWPFCNALCASKLEVQFEETATMTIKILYGLFYCVVFVMNVVLIFLSNKETILYKQSVIHTIVLGVLFFRIKSYTKQCKEKA